MDIVQKIQIALIALNLISLFIVIKSQEAIEKLKIDMFNQQLMTYSILDDIATLNKRTSEDKKQKLNEVDNGN